MYAKRQTTFPCDICSKTYTAFNTLKNHKSSVHNVKVQNWKSEKQNFRGVTITPGQGPVRKVVSCNICAKQFESVELLAKHLVSGVHGKDKCNICHKKFSSVHFLAKHLVSGDHRKGKQVGVSSNKAVKTNPKVVDVIDVDLDDEPIKFNIPQPVQKVTAAKKRRSDGDNVEAENVKKVKVDTDLVVEEEPKHWLDRMMKEVDDFSNNLINLVGDVKKNWSCGVKSEQCVTDTTEKLREVLQISKNYIELIDKSVIDEYWANNQSGLWAQIAPIDEETAALDVEAATLDENVTTTDEDGNSLDESVSLDENEETETVCTPDLPDMDLDAQIDLDGEPVFETAEESNDTVEETVEDNSASETVDEVIADEDEPIDCDTETTVDTITSDTVGDQSDEETEIKKEENDGSILEEKPEDAADSEMNAKDCEEATEEEEDSEENVKQDETSKEEKEDSESEEETEKRKEKTEEVNETNEVEETEEDKTKTATMEDTDVEEKTEEEESVKEDEEQETSESSGNKSEDSAKVPPSSGMVLFASWCQ